MPFSGFCEHWAYLRHTNIHAVKITFHTPEEKEINKGKEEKRKEGKKGRRKEEGRKERRIKRRKEGNSNLHFRKYVVMALNCTKQSMMGQDNGSVSSLPLNYYIPSPRTFYDSFLEFRYPCLISLTIKHLTRLVNIMT